MTLVYWLESEDNDTASPYCKRCSFLKITLSLLFSNRYIYQTNTHLLPSFRVKVFDRELLQDSCLGEGVIKSEDIARSLASPGRLNEGGIQVTVPLHKPSAKTAVPTAKSGQPRHQNQTKVHPISLPSAKQKTEGDKGEEEGGYGEVVVRILTKALNVGYDGQ